MSPVLTPSSQEHIDYLKGLLNKQDKDLNSLKHQVHNLVLENTKLLFKVEEQRIEISKLRRY